MHKIHFISLFILIPIGLCAQSTSDWQWWNNVVVGSNISNKVYAHADFRHRQGMGKGNDSWSTSGVLLRGEYALSKLFTPSFEALFQHSKQSELVKNHEYTQRLGLKLNIFRNGVNLFKLSKGLEGSSARLELTNLTRFEHRLFTYTTDEYSESYWRLRNRTQVKWALNRESLLEYKLLLLDANVELFLPLSTEPQEKYLSKVRFRVGPEYKYSARWRFRLLYAFDHSGNGFSKGSNIESQMISLRIKYVL